MNEKREIPRLDLGDRVEVIAWRMPATFSLHCYDGSTGTVISETTAKNQRMLRVKIIGQHEDARSGNVWVPEHALKVVAREGGNGAGERNSGE